MRRVFSRKSPGPFAVRGFFVEARHGSPCPVTVGRQGEPWHALPLVVASAELA
jgi:hypothetical protein